MLTLTTLEDVLTDDHHGRKRGEWLAQLTEAADALSRRLREPCLADEFAVLTRQRAACLAAIVVIETIWARLRM